MSLLLSQVGAYTPPPTPAIRSKITNLDDGSIEIRGLVRVGFAVAAAIVAVTPAIRVQPAQLEQPVDLTGRVTVAQQVTAVTPTATPAVRIVGRLDEPATLTGRVSSAFQVAATVTAATPAVRVTSAIPEPPTAIVGRVATGWPVTAATPAATPAVRLVAVLDDPATTVGRITSVVVVGVRPTVVIRPVAFNGDVPAVGVVRYAFTVAAAPVVPDVANPGYTVRAPRTSASSARATTAVTGTGGAATPTPEQVVIRAHVVPSQTTTKRPVFRDPTTPTSTAVASSDVTAHPPTVLGGS